MLLSWAFLIDSLAYRSITSCLVSGAELQNVEGRSALCPSHRALSLPLLQPHGPFLLCTGQAHWCLRAGVPAAPSTLTCPFSHSRHPSPRRLRFSLVVPPSERPSWSTHYRPRNILLWSFVKSSVVIRHFTNTVTILLPTPRFPQPDCRWGSCPINPLPRPKA